MPALPVTVDQLSNTELAIALLNPALRYHPRTLRLGAARLSAPGNAVDEIARLAELGRCQAIVGYIAECGRKFEPQNLFWKNLLALLPKTPPRQPWITLPYRIHDPP